MGKILSITEMVPTESSLPDGTYPGIWGGYNIDVKHNGKTYHLKTDIGVRGMGFPVVVTVMLNCVSPGKPGS